MRRKWLLLTLLILFVVVGWRIKTDRVWWQAVEKGERAELKISVTERPTKSWQDYRVDYRGRRVICPETQEGCGVWATVQVGDKLWVEVEPKVTGKEYLVRRVEKFERIKPVVVNYWWWVRQTDKLRNQIITIYRLVLSEPYAGLLAGVVLGVQSSLSNDFYQALVRTGTMHIVAASGFNITLVAGMALGVLVLVVPRRAALAGAVAAIGGYVLLAGASPAVVRAGIMGGLTFMAQATGRAYTAGWSLIITAVLMLIISPWLINSVSFQLSVAATAGIIWGQPKIQRMLMGRKAIGREGGQWRKMVVADLATTLAATLSTLPISMVTFGQVSLISPLVNGLVLWLIPPMMVLGGVIALMGLVWLNLAQIVAWLTWPLMYGFVIIVEGLGGIPWALVTLAGVSWWLGLGWWLILAGWWANAREA